MSNNETNKVKTIWLTGLSGSGKTTISNQLKKYFDSNNLPIVCLDGDVLRANLNSDLGYTDKDRTENVRRVASVAKCLNDQNFNVIVALITPLNEQRKLARNIIGDSFFEVYLDCPISVCEERDVKGLYLKARKGLISNFTGVSHGFETPDNSNLIISTFNQNVESSVNEIIERIKNG